MRSGRRDMNEAEPEQPLTTVYVVNGTRTSAGPGPGVQKLPPRRQAGWFTPSWPAPGDQPPRNFPGDGQPGAAPPAREFI